VKKSGSPASQNQDTKEQKSVPQQTEQEQPKIQLLDSILRNPNATLGMLLSAARKDAGLSLESVSNTTRITQSYLVAMESDNGAKLPPLVFLNSYIRSLCQCYHLKDDVAQVFLSKVTSTEDYVLSDADKTIAILSGSNVSLNSGEQQEDEQGIASENEDRKIRSYIFIGAGIAAVAVVIIIAVILTSVFSNSRPDREEVSDNIGIAAVKQKPSEVSAAESAGGNEKATDSVSSKDLEILNAPCILGASSVKMQSKIEIK